MEGKLTRRLAMTGALALVAPTTTPAAIGDDPDAELVRLGKEFDAARAIEKRLWERGSDEDDAAYAACSPEACSHGESPCIGECAQNRTMEIVHQIVDLPCHTLAGLRVKAAVSRYFYDGHEVIDVGDEVRSQIAEFLAPDCRALPEGGNSREVSP